MVCVKQVVDWEAVQFPGLLSDYCPNTSPADGAVCLLTVRTYRNIMAASSVFRPGLYNHKVAIVTGGGTGIGKAISAELLELGESNYGSVKHQLLSIY